MPAADRAPNPSNQDPHMRLKQRDMNRKALQMAAAMVENADFASLFGDDAFPDDERDEDVLAKAQAAAVRRIRALAGDRE
jgi:hypothetical protein